MTHAIPSEPEHFHHLSTTHITAPSTSQTPLLIGTYRRGHPLLNV